jgi:hypothetical protein
MVALHRFDPSLGHALSLGDGLIGMEHTERHLDSLGRGKALHIASKP